MTSKQTGARALGRREVLAGAAIGGAAAAAASFPTPALSQGAMAWRMVTTWPKNFSGLGTGAELLASLIGQMSGGRLTVTVYGAGEIVPPFEAIEAVASGSVEMGHGTPYYWKGKVPAMQFLTSVPFGLTAQEQNAWLAYGGGQELADACYAQVNCKFFASGNTGVQMGGWFNREINTIEDYKGLKMRLPGLAGEVVAAAGATVVNMPGGEIATAMASGSIDAVDWVGPYNDLAFGLYQNAAYYYYPGWQEPSGMLDNFINLDAWNSLPDDLKAIVAAANGAVNTQVLSEFIARNNESLRVLRDEHGVDVRPYPPEVLRELAGLSAQVVTRLAGEDALSTSLFESLKAFRKDAVGWAAYSEQAFLEARSADPSW